VTAPQEPVAGVGCVLLSYGSTSLSESVASLGLAGFRTKDVVVVHNPSSDAPRPNGAQEAGQIVVLPDNRGYSAGMNAGAALLVNRGCSLLLLLTPGVKLDPLSTRAAVRTIAGDSSIGLLAPMMYSPGGTVISAGGRLTTAWRPVHLTEVPSTKDCVSVDWVDGAAVLIRTSLLPLPEEYFLYWEDVSLSLTARRAGWVVAVDPRWRAETTPGASVRPDVFRYLSWRNRLHCANALAPAWSRAGAWLEWLGAVATRPLQSLVRGSPRQAGRTLRILLRAGLDAARGRLGIPPDYVLWGSDVTATRLPE